MDTPPMKLEQHFELVQLTLSRHLLFPTCGIVEQDRRALKSLATIAQHCGVELPAIGEPQTLDKPGQAQRNAEHIRQAAQEHRERKRR